MPAWLGFWEILFVLALFLLFFGARRIPEIGRGLGLGIRNFKGEMKERDSLEDPRRTPGEEAGRGPADEAGPADRPS